MSLSYALVTPARNEAENLERLGACLAAQSVTPSCWVVVDNGSTDATLQVARGLALRYDWITVLEMPGESTAVRGRPIVRAFMRALDELDSPPDVFVNVDADISVEPGYFQSLLARFDDDPRLGIASGSAYEIEDGAWLQRHVTGSTVWGASRAYRWACLQQVLPLEERLGWDGLDEYKANARGWRTATFTDLPFKHHRREGERDASRFKARAAQGEGSYYQGYAFWYLVLRSVHNARTDPAALGMIAGYAGAAVRRQPRCADLETRAYLRRQQSVRHLLSRFREVSRTRETLADGG